MQFALITTSSLAHVDLRWILALLFCLIEFWTACGNMHASNLNARNQAFGASGCDNVDLVYLDLLDISSLG